MYGPAIMRMGLVVLPWQLLSEPALDLCVEAYYYNINNIFGIRFRI